MHMKKDEILWYLETPSDETGLFEQSDKVRSTYCGQTVHIRGIIEFSNHCVRNCLYCGLRHNNAYLSRYRIEADEIIALAHSIVLSGIKTIVLQSGDDFHYSQATMCRIISTIKEKTSAAITLSVGERPFEDYLAFKEAGADRYLLKHETANETLYEKLHPRQSLKNRLAALEYLRKIGFQIGTGNIVGLPGQTLDDLCADILLMQDMDPDMASVGVFIPQKQTPLAELSQGNTLLSLKIIALTRIVTKNSHIPITTALATAEPKEGLVKGLKAGANVIMPNFTPPSYRKDYNIYDNKAHIDLKKTKSAILEANRIIATDQGNSYKLSFSKHQSPDSYVLP